VLGANGDTFGNASEVMLCAIGSMVSVAWEASAKLSKMGIRATVVNARFIKPLDAETICSVAQRAGRVVTIEENVKRGGFGEAVRDAIAERGLNVPVSILALPDLFVEHGAQPIIRSQVGLDVDGIVDAAFKMCGSRVTTS
jgi:1-deoxy-D-xylulose-5-phosphate synthase